MTTKLNSRISRKILFLVPEGYWHPTEAGRMCHGSQTRGITERFISYRKYTLQITQPSKYRCTQLQCRFAVISEAPSINNTYMSTAFDKSDIQELVMSVFLLRFIV